MLRSKARSEIDETYVGGKAKNRHRGDPRHRHRTADKVAVIGALERGGEAVAMVIGSTATRVLDGFVHAVVSPGVTLVSTDEHAGYRHLSRTYKHQVVRHTAGGYVSGDCHTNGIEGFWSILKRQIVGIHHVVTPKHLSRYVAEVTWRFNRRDNEEAVRLNALLAAADCRPLQYRELIA
jgi:hypothetical protein